MVCQQSGVTLILIVEEDMSMALLNTFGCSPLNKQPESNFELCLKKGVPFPSYDMRSLAPRDKLLVMLYMSYYIIQLLRGVPAL